MKVKLTGLGEVEIKELTQAERIKLTGYRTSIVNIKSGNLIGENLGELYVKIYELCGLPDKEWDKLKESEKPTVLMEILNAWYPDEKK